MIQLPLRLFGVTVTGSVLRWGAVSFGFFLYNFPALYVLVDVLRLPLALATLCAIEGEILLRYPITDRFVFGHPRPSLRRLVEFHVSTAGAFVIWWIVANGLPLLGVHYLIAAAAASCCSVFLNLLAHFKWIWRRGV